MLNAGNKSSLRHYHNIVASIIGPYILLSGVIAMAKRRILLIATLCLLTGCSSTPQPQAQYQQNIFIQAEQQPSQDAIPMLAGIASLFLRKTQSDDQPQTNNYNNQNHYHHYKRPI